MDIDIQIFDVMYERAICSECGWQLDHFDRATINRAVEQHFKDCPTAQQENEQ